MSEKRKEIDIFGMHGIGYTKLLEEISENLNETKFHIFSEQYLSEVIKENSKRGRQLYCIDILENVRVSAITGLLRSFRWLQGMNEAYSSSNYLAFCATFRGFMLSAADCYYSLSPIPRTISENAKMLQEMLGGNDNSKVLTFYDLKPLENLFEHFLLARKQKRDETLDVNQQAKSDAEYVKKLQGANTGLYCDCYYELCEITHPASSSVLYLVEMNETDGNFLRFDADHKYIISFCQKYSTIIPRLFETAFNGGLFILGLMNLMNNEVLATPAVNSKNFGSMPKWNEFKANVENAFSTA